MVVHCPDCHIACLDEMPFCPQCGRALGESRPETEAPQEAEAPPEEPEGPPQSLELPPQSPESLDFEAEERVYREIGFLRMLGAGMIVFGIFGFVSCLMFEQTEWAVAAVQLAFVGVLTRALGGIWATLERIARE